MNVNWIAAQMSLSIGNSGETLNYGLGQMSVLSAWQKLFDARLILAQTGTGNVIPGSNRSPGSPQRAALDTRSAVSAKLQLSQPSIL